MASLDARKCLGAQVAKYQKVVDSSDDEEADAETDGNGKKHRQKAQKRRSSKGGRSIGW